MINSLQVGVYPVGIPLWFYYLLKRYRKRMNRPGIRVQLGFLYEGRS